VACETIRTFFYVFLRFLTFFQNPKTWLFTFFELLRTFSRILVMVKFEDARISYQQRNLGIAKVIMEINFQCLSVCLSHECIVTKRKRFVSRFLYHMKERYPSFQTRRIVGGERPVVPVILGQTDPVCAKTPIFNRYLLVAPQPLHIVKKSSINRNTRFQWAYDEHRTLLLSPPKRLKPQNGRFTIKIALLWKNVCVRTVSNKVVMHSLARLSVQKWWWGRPLKGKFWSKSGLYFGQNWPTLEAAARSLCDSSATCSSLFCIL